MSDRYEAAARPQLTLVEEDRFSDDSVFLLMADVLIRAPEAGDQPQVIDLTDPDHHRYPVSIDDLPREVVGAVHKVLADAFAVYPVIDTRLSGRNVDHL